MKPSQNVLILGASGMLGHVVLRWFVGQGHHTVSGSVRSETAMRRLPAGLHEHVIIGADVDSTDSLAELFVRVRPTVVVNCVGLVKQLTQAEDPLAALPINALLPHRLARLCALVDARLVHISTDCVFSGRRGNYQESDVADAEDLYGRSKLLGEIVAAPAVTLRTSIIGPELGSAHGLIGWFLSQPGPVRGFTRAVFSGLPTVELARVIHDIVVPNTDLTGLYHVSAESITKFDLLVRVARIYGRAIEIWPDDAVAIDRSLDSTRFRAATGYTPPGWDDLVAAMHRFG
jgi:dTDP-4-dehydrorhamnose reductase